MFGRKKQSQPQDARRGTPPADGRKAPRRVRRSESWASPASPKRQPPPRRSIPAEERLEHEKLLEHVAAVEYGLPYDTPEEKALVREIYQWQQAEGGGYFIVRKLYRKGVRLPVLTTGSFPSQDFVENTLWDTYGGGDYVVYKGKTPRILAKYEIAGPSWFRPHAKVDNHAPFEE